MSTVSVFHCHTAFQLRVVMIIAVLGAMMNLIMTDAARADWPTHRGNDQRTGFHEQPLTAARWSAQWVNSDNEPPAPAWPAPARASLWQRLDSLEPRANDDRGDVPLVVRDLDGGDHILMGSSSTDRLIAIDPATGKQQWEFMADAPIRFAPSVAEGIAYFGSDDGMVRAIDLRNGELVWTRRLGPEMPWIVGNERLISTHAIRTSTIVKDGVVYANAGLFPTHGVYTVAMRADDGTLVWQRRTERSPQGYLLTDSKERLYIPCGRATPYAVSTENGRYLMDCPSPGGTFCMITPAAFFSGPGNDPSVGTYRDVPDAKMVPVGGRAISVGHGKLWAADGQSIACFDLSKRVIQRKGSELWRTPCDLQTSMIVSGDSDNMFAFVAGGSRIDVFNAITGEKTAQLQVAQPDENIQYMAVAAGSGDHAGAHDRLIATTDAGRVYCWLGSRTTEKSNSWTEVDSAASVERDEANEGVRRRVAEALDALPSDAGYALVLGDNDGVYCRELLRTSRLHIVSIVADRDICEKLRHQYLRTGQYGERIAVINRTDEVSQAFSMRMFNLALEATPTSLASEKIERLVDSGTGVVSRPGRDLIVREPLRGAGSWRHQYANPTNTADSRDRVVGNANGFRLQWFGGVGPAQMPDRHLRASAPLSAGSATVLHGDGCLIGIDPANGTPRWELELPAGSMRYVMPYDAGYSCLTADGSTFYTATPKAIWTINAYTGDVQQQIALPENADGMSWGYLSEVDGALFASSMKPTAARLQGPAEELISSKQSSDDTPFFARSEMREWYTSNDYDSVRPLVCSRKLYRLQPRSEPGTQPDWVYPSEGVIPNATISLNRDASRMIFIEGNSDGCRDHETDRVSVPMISEDADVVCLRTDTGEVLWREPLDMPGAKNVLHTQIVKGRVVITTSESKEAGALYKLLVMRLADGERQWNAEHAHITDGLFHGEQVQHPLALEQSDGDVVLVAEPYMYALDSGKRIVPEGEPSDWSIRRPGHSCGTLSGAGDCVFFRATNPTVMSMTSPGVDRFTKLSPSRPNCWINMIPSNGRLLIPEGSASCVCLFPLQTSMGFAATQAEDEIPVLPNFPVLKQESLEELYAWDLAPRKDKVEVTRAKSMEVLPTAGELPLKSALDLDLRPNGLHLDGQQWLATDLERGELPSMPLTVSLEAYVKVASETPEWSAMISILQDNGSYERGCGLGVHHRNFFFSVAAEGNGSMTYLESPSEFEYDRFYHVVGTYDGNSMRLYVDGKLKTITTSQDGAVWFDHKSWMGVGIYKDDDDHHPLVGTLGRVSVFRGAMSQAEVRQRYEQTTP